MSAYRRVANTRIDVSNNSCAQAFTLRVRPALDTMGSVVDRTRMSIYKMYARLGLPCPVTGSHGVVGSAALAHEQHQQQPP